MPCNSDYLRARPEEIERKRAAQLLVFVYRQMGDSPSSDLIKQSEHYYGEGRYTLKQLVQLLCERLKNMRPSEFDHIVYNGRDKTSRDLADWWEEHQKADEAEKEAREAALAKLTPDERRLLGL